MRKTVRLDEVRAPRTPSDSLAPDAVLNADSQAATLAEHYNGVLTQIRGMLGGPSWREPPQASLAALDAARRADAQTLDSQRQNLAALGHQLDSQAQAVTALQDATQSVLQAQALIASLQRTVANVAATAATEDQLGALAAQVATLGSGLDGTLAALRLQISGLTAQADQDQARLAALESKTGAYVTASGLQYALARAYAVGQVLAGLQNGKNLTFEAPARFYASTLTLFYNGQSLRQGLDGDYVVENIDSSLTSKTVRLLHPEAAPVAQDILTASYMPA